jgi:hypothetical protein
MLRSFLLQLFGLSLLIAGILFYVVKTPYFEAFATFSWVSLVFLMCSTLLVYLILLRAMKMKSHSSFVSAFGVAFATKSLGSMIFLCYFIFVKPIGDNHFIVPFFAMYFAYTGLLMWQVWKQSKLPHA